MLRKIKTNLGFIYRGLLWIKDTIIDNPKILDIKPMIIWKTQWWADILCYKFGEWKEKILYFGWIHGNEVGTVKLMKRWINFIWGTPNNVDFWNKQIFIIPCLNVDWYKGAIEKPEYFSGWRYGKTNGNNVDLNRNFPASNWSKVSTLFAAWKYEEISWWEEAWWEPEVKALLELLIEENISTIYTFHNCWGTVFGRGTNSVQAKVKSYSKHSWYRIFADWEWDWLKDGQKTGQMMTWAQEKNIDTIEVECKTRWWSEWKQNKSALIESLKL